MPNRIDLTRDVETNRVEITNTTTNVTVELRGGLFGLSGSGSGEVNVQADWNETNVLSDAFIQNKPTLFDGAYSSLTGVPSNFPASAHTHTSSEITDFTSAVNALITAGTGEVNVQADWDETDNTSDAFILNKPTLFDGQYSSLTGVPSTFTPSAHTHTASEITDFTTEVNLLITASGGEANVQSDWTETDSGLDSFILNKPTNLSDFTNDLTLTHDDITDFDTEVTALITANETNTFADLTDTTFADLQAGNTVIYDGADWVNAPGLVTVEVHNNTGSLLAKGRAVYVSGTNVSGKPEVTGADSNGASTYPAIGLVYADIANGGEGKVIVSGLLEGVDTSTFSSGSALYVDSTPGLLTSTRPTASSDKVQKVGLAVRIHATTGSILVMGAGRTNDVPNELTALTGVALNDTDLGTFTGGIITANTDIKTALQELETATPTVVSDLTNDANYISNITAESLGDLSDVIITSPLAGSLIVQQTSGDFLKLGAGTFANSYLQLDDMGDVAAGATNGQVLAYNTTTSQWEPTTPASSITSIDDIGDVDTTTSAPAIGDLLQWDGSQWEPTAFALPVTDGASGQTLTTDGSGTVSWGNIFIPTPTLQAVTSAGATSSDAVTLTGGLTINTNQLDIGGLYKLPIASGTTNQVLTWGGTGNDLVWDLPAAPTLDAVTTTGNSTSNGITVGTFQANSVTSLGAGTFLGNLNVFGGGTNTFTGTITALTAILGSTGNTYQMPSVRATGDRMVLHCNTASGAYWDYIEEKEYVKTNFSGRGVLSSSEDLYYILAGGFGTGLQDDVTYEVASLPTTVIAKQHAHVIRPATYSGDVRIEVIVSNSSSATSSFSAYQSQPVEAFVYKVTTAATTASWTQLGTTSITMGTDTRVWQTGTITLTNETFADGDRIAVVLKGTQSIASTTYFFYGYDIELKED